MAVAHLYSLLGDEGLQSAVRYLGDLDAHELEIIRQQIDGSINTPLTSSCGRLFDAVAALLGFGGETSYEGQAASELEMRAYEGDGGEGYPFTIAEGEPALIIQLSAPWQAVLGDLAAGVPGGAVALRFHSTGTRMGGEMGTRRG